MKIEGALQSVHPVLLILRSALVMSGLVANNCLAQLPQAADSRLGMDVLRLQDGKKIYGFVLAEEQGQGFDIAVERDWLAQTHPKLYERLETSEREQLEHARRQLEDRISAWIAERKEPVDAVLIRFLESELSRIREISIEDQLGSRFMVWKVQRHELRDLKQQLPLNRHIAGLAYQAGFEQVVTTPVSILKRRLTESGVDIQSAAVDLTDQIPTLQLQSARAWAAKRALVEYGIREELEFQGTGNKLFRKTAAGVDVSNLIGTLFGSSSMDAVSQLGAELGLPEFKQLASKDNDDWRKRVAREAEAEGCLGVLVTRLEQHVLSTRVKVETQFLAAEKVGGWFVVFRAAVAEDVQAQSSERVRRIKQDPQIKQVLDTLDQLGLSAGDRLDLALRHGVATERAMNKTSGQFNSFLARHTRTLDGMPVPINMTPLDARKP